MVCMKFASVYEEMRVSKKYESALALSSTHPENATYYVTGLLNCPKSGKIVRFMMVEGTVVK